MELEILYHDKFIIAINKPNGLAVHRSSYIGNTADVFALQELRNQIGQRVYPCHRLDRKTSGVLLFALDSESNKNLHAQFINNGIVKKYLAIVRGHTEEDGTIDYPLKNEKGVQQEAITYYTTLNKTELDIPFGRFNTSRYSILEVKPQTGRIHQIRKHLAHINHPIIGDRPHGCNKQNKLFKDKFSMTTMMLHAKELTFTHPTEGNQITLQAPVYPEFSRMIETLKL